MARTAATHRAQFAAWNAKKSPKQRAAAYQQWYLARRAAGLCRDCRTPVTKFTRCPACRQAMAPQRAAYMRKRRRELNAA
jgi:hypothetical protein